MNPSPLKTTHHQSKKAHYYLANVCFKHTEEPKTKSLSAASTSVFVMLMLVGAPAHSSPLTSAVVFVCFRQSNPSLDDVVVVIDIFDICKSSNFNTTVTSLHLFFPLHQCRGNKIKPIPNTKVDKFF